MKGKQKPWRPWTEEDWRPWTEEEKKDLKDLGQAAEDLATIIVEAIKDTIVKQSARIAELEAALRPFAKAVDNCGDWEYERPLSVRHRKGYGITVGISVQDLRTARAALRGQGAEGAGASTDEGEGE